MMLNDQARAKALKDALCRLSSVEITNQGLEVTLPQAYHSGHAVAVVVEMEADGSAYVHDSGYAAMLLENLGVRANAALQAQLKASVHAYGCEIAGFRVFRRCQTLEEVAFCAVTVGCASRLVADYALKVDAPPLFDFKRALLGKVAESIGSDRIRENEDVTVEKGTTYKVSAVILNWERTQPLAYLEPVSGHQAVARKFREFYDLMNTPSLSDIERIAVYDDGKADITPGDILLLQDVSNPVRFRDTAARLQVWGTRH